MTHFEYDSRGRMVLESLPNGDFIADQYDAQGQRTQVQTPHGLTRYTYDTLGRLDSVIAPNNGITRYFYTAVGSQDSVKRANGTSTRYTYDALNRLTSESRNGAAANNYSYTYTYDAVGNRLTFTQGSTTRQSTYNSRDQLLIEGNTSSSTVYTYDAAGRLRTQSGNGSSLTYHWSDEDRLAAITGGASPIEYTYDFEGRRVAEAVGGVTRQYLIDRLLPYGQVVAETDGNNLLVAQFNYGLDRLSQQRNGGTSFYLADGQGSIRQLTDTAGVVTDTWLYSAFGVELARTGTSENEFRYVGEQFDANSGFYYNRARWMDPSAGRFVSVDRYVGDPQAPVSLHRYLYANQSPVSFKDPTGNWTLVEVSFTVARLGFLYTNVAIGSTMLRFAVATPTDKIQKCWYNCMVDQTSNYISAIAAIFSEGFVSTPKFLLNPGNTGGPNPFTNIIRNLSISLRGMPSMKKAPEMLAQFVKRGPISKVPVYAANTVYLAASGMILYNAISCMQKCTRDPSCYEHSSE
jgi:RHS repeat-associated protein